MKLKYLVSLFSLFSSGIGLIAQADTSIATSDALTQHRLFFSYGQVYFLKIDKTYSRLAKGGLNHFFNLGYAHTNAHSAIDVQGNFITGTLSSTENNANIIDNYAGGMRVKYLKGITTKVRDLSLYLGGNVNFDGNLWFPQESRLRYAWDINLGGGLAASLRYRVNTSISLQYDFDISILGVLWRSHNNGQQLTTEEIQLEDGGVAAAFETPRFSHLFNTAYIDNSFKIFYTLLRAVDVYYNFILTYDYIKHPLVKKGYEFNNVLGVTFNF